jgi:photosystem II stability/assembly factor-like uncharacterized protein
MHTHRAAHIGAALLAVLIPLRLAGQSSAAPPTIFAPVLATRLFVVGAANPRTGVFLQQPSDDTLWGHTGSTTIRAFGFALGPRSGGRVRYIAAGNGVHLSRDGGRTWKTGWEITEVMCVVPDPSDTNVVYCTTPYGVFKTVDGCATWQEMSSGLTSLFVSSMIIGKDGRLYCATEDGLFWSGDGARHWERTGLSVCGTRVVAQSPADPSFLIVGTESYGLYVSHDSGNVWARSESGVDHMTFYTVAFDPVNPLIIYAGGYVTGVYRSVDGALSWRRVNEGLSNLNVHGIAVDPTDHDRVYAATLWGGVYRTDDGGGHWRSAGLSGAEVWNVVINTF